MRNINQILKEVLVKVNPSEKDLSSINKFLKDFIPEIKKELKKIIDSEPLVIDYEKYGSDRMKEYIVSSSIIKLQGQRILSVIFYSTETKAPLFQVFADHNSFVSYNFEKKKFILYVYKM